MSTFVQKLSSATGKLEWEVEDINYDYHREVARSAYADMLHDKERNHKYHMAVRWAIQKMKSQNRPAHVLDIGTGTGLLSMMAARNGADSVTACETFLPMANCAEKVIDLNGLSGQIKLLRKHSTDVEVGPGLDMEFRANILVTEVFDTELIGEGAIATFNHAHRCLLEENSIVIPSRGTIWGQVVESDLINNWNRLQTIQVGDRLLRPPPDTLNCPGASAVHDIQISQLPEDSFTAVTDPVELLRFDFSGQTKMPDKRKERTKCLARTGGNTQAVLMWWDIHMADTEDDNAELSCAPWWSHPAGSRQPWRDHWMQAVYYVPEAIPVNEGQQLDIVACHDEYSVWFHVTDEQSNASDKPVCVCGAHIVYSRTRMGQVNEQKRNHKYIKALKSLVNEESVCLTLGNGCLLSHMAASLGAKSVYALEANTHSKQFMDAFSKHNKLGNVTCLRKRDDEDLTQDDIHGQKISLLISEPHFFTSMLPWNNLYFWYQRHELKNHLSPDVKILPVGGTIKALPVHFEHLWKIRARVTETEGFYLTPFDDIIENACNVSDPLIEPQPLWEYPCIALSETIELMTFDFKQAIPSEPLRCEGTQILKGSDLFNGVALWMEWQLLEDEPDLIVSTGPTAPPQPGQKVKWDIHSKQGVYLFREKNISSEYNLRYEAAFHPGNGDVTFSILEKVL